MRSTEHDAKAKAAVMAFKSMTPSLTGFARAISGNPKVTIELSTSSSSYTDGTRIFVHPPISLGEKQSHVRESCGKRDSETLLLTCPECRRREGVLGRLYHEIGHIAYGTFKQPSPAEIAEAVKKAAQNRVSSNLNTTSYMGISSSYNPYLPTLINALEDVRVDTAMFKARSGTRTMFEARVRETMESGIDTHEGRVFWNTRPLNAQIAVGILLKAGGYRYKGYLAPQVEEALDDPILSELIAPISEYESATAVYHQSFKIVDRLQELGFMLTDSPDKNEDDSQGEALENESEQNHEAGVSSGGNSQPENSTSLPGGPGDGQGELDSDSRDSDSNESDGSNEGASDHTHLDESDPEAILIDTGEDEGNGGIKLDYGTPSDVDSDLSTVNNHTATGAPELDDFGDSEKEVRAVNTFILKGLYFETTPLNVNGVCIFRYKDGKEGADAWMSDSEVKRVMSSEHSTTADEAILGAALSKMRRIFMDNERARFENHLRSGKVNARVLGKRAWANDPRLFRKKYVPQKKSYSVLIGIDVSGSTVGRNNALAKRAAFAQAELCSRMGIEFGIFAHTANRVSVAGSMDHRLDIYEIKSFDEPWNEATQDALRHIGADSENLDGHTIQFYRKMIEKQDSTDKIILYYSDGKMPAANFDEELEVLQSEIRTCRKRGITLLGVGIRTDSPTKHGLETVRVDSDEDLVKVVMHLEKALIHNR